MFLNKNYILANELVEKMNINIANISILKKQYEDEDDNTTIVKLNNCSFIKGNSYKLPNNIRIGIDSFEFTDMSDKLPCSYFKSEYGFSDKEIMNSSIVYQKVNVSGKQFYQFDPEFVKKVKNAVMYPLDKKETDECYSKGQIAGYVQMAKNKFLTWYPKYG